MFYREDFKKVEAINDQKQEAFGILKYLLFNLR